MSDAEDLRLVRAAVGGDPIAIQALLVINRAPLLDYVQRNLPPALANSVEPDDVVQDVCIEAYKRIAEFVPRSTGAVVKWLMTIARHRMIDLLRTHKAIKRGSDRQLKLNKAGESDSKVIALIETLAVYSRTPSRSAAAHELAVAIERSINALPSEYRQAITLRHLEGIPAKDAAVQMKRTEGAFHQLCHRGLKHLRQHLRSASIYL